MTREDHLKAAQEHLRASDVITAAIAKERVQYLTGSYAAAYAEATMHSSAAVAHFLAAQTEDSARAYAMAQGPVVAR